MSNNPRRLGLIACELPPFHARAPWLGGDLQTLRNTLHFAPPDLAAYRRHSLQLPLRDGSGDALIASLNLPSENGTKPLVVLIHGLTGSETSRNILASTAYHLSRGHPVLRLNLRNAGPSRGKCRHFYHAGRSQDLRDALAALPGELTAHGVFLVGVSLGGNMLLKGLSEREGLERVIGAASVCAPIDLKAAQMRIMARRNFVYQHHLLGFLVRDSRFIVKDTPLAARLPALRTIYDFDDRIVAPLGGFTGADDYYARSSAGPRLGAVAKPTLLIAAADDPWIPLASYTNREWLQNEPLSVAITPGGGHVGFHAKDSAVPWHDRAIGAYIDSLR
ncbi:MAG: YheT family hydrolase [Rhodospirillaceae bacterium]